MKHEDSKIPLKGALNISELMKDGATFEVNFDHEDEPEQLAYTPEDAYLYNNPACLDITDEDTYQDDQPFENIAKSMTAISTDGKIKKKIIRAGYGNDMPHMATVTVEYNAYLEYSNEPFDSTYIRKRPLKFRLNAGEAIIGLDLAVQTMKVNEKSQFLIDPEYAYGSLGCLERVPPNSTCLFEIEVTSVVDSGASYTYENLAESEQNDFEEIYKYAIALCAKAKDLCKRGGWKPAIKEYNMAVSKLENCRLRDERDQEKQQNMLLRLYTNLAVVFTKLQEPRRGCVNCNKVLNMCKGTSLKPSAKLFFNNARCLMLLGDLKEAEKRLKQAQKLEPHNIEISDELKKLENEKKKKHERELSLAKAYFTPKNVKTDTVVAEEFKESMKLYCEDIVVDTKLKSYTLPNEMSDAQLEFVSNEAKKHGLGVEKSKVNGATRYFIVKPNNSNQVTDKMEKLVIN